MTAEYEEVFQGTLVRCAGPSDPFSCRLVVQVPEIGTAPGTERVSTPITGGFVDWGYLGKGVNVTTGTIDLFSPAKEQAGSTAIDYLFRFNSGGGEYVFRGQKRLKNGSGTSAAEDLSNLYVSIENSRGPIATGTLSCQLDQLLNAYEGVLAEAKPQAEILPVLQNYCDFINHNLTALYPYFPPVLAPGRQMPEGLRKTLEVLAEVMLPVPPPAGGPSIDDVVGNINRFLQEAPAKQFQVIRTLLQVVSIFVPVLTLAIDEVRKIVRDTLNNENDSPIRQALSGVHLIVVLAYYADCKADGLIGYNRPKHNPKHQTTLPISLTIPDRKFDVVIAGTGPAGALLADRLSRRGKSVLLLEAGAYIPERDITTDEVDSIARLYKQSGLQVSKRPSSVTVLQGACVGGGGVINNGLFFPLPTGTLQVWRNAGFPFDEQTMWQAYRTVAKELNIGDIAAKKLRLNPAGPYLESKLGKLQPPPLGPVPPGFYTMLVNLETVVGDGEDTGCLSTGLCNIGCGSERKVNSYQYYLKHALDGTRDVVLVPRASVVRAVMDTKNTTRSVQALEVRMGDGRKLLARGDSFVLCCGPVGSSGVLLRSSDLLGAASRNLPVGKRFCGNVASPVFARVEAAANQKTAVQMCHVYVPSAPNDGFLIETWFSPPGGLALAMPGFLDTHANRMSQYEHLLSASPVIGTSPCGAITLQGDSTAIDLPLSPEDLDRFRHGMILLVTALLDAQTTPVIVRLGNGRVIANRSDLNALNAEMSRLSPKDLHLLPLSTAHPQGGNALSEDPTIGVVGKDFRVRGIDNLRVCDGSVFPAVAGVNPQWTIFALADVCAAGIK